MNLQQQAALRALLRRQEVAALGTLHDGEPFVFYAALMSAA